MCKKINNRTNALLSVRKFVDQRKDRILCSAYILSGFYYCNLICMFCSKSAEKRISRTHKRALSAVYTNFNLSLVDLLRVDGTVNIHTVCLRALMLEVYKTVNKSNPKFLWNFFQIKDIPYKLRGGHLLTLPKTLKRTYGLYGLKFRASFVWNNLPASVKNSENTMQFKYEVGKLQHFTCNCKCCLYLVLISFFAIVFD